MLTMPAAKPLRPVTVATTSWGKRSEGRVKPIVDQLAKPHNAMQISTRAVYALWTWAAGIPASIGRQLTAHTQRRARTTEMPRRIQKPEIQPPVKLPTSAAMNGIQANAAISFRLKPRESLRYWGNQNT